MRWKETPVLLDVTFHQENEHTVLTVSIKGASGDYDREELARSITRMLSLDHDLAAFYRTVASDPVISGIAQTMRGFRIVTDIDLFECILWTIIAQQLSLQVAATLKKRFLEHYGQRVTVDGESWLCPPAPEAVARLKYDDLRALKFSQSKSEYIIDIARAIVEGQFRPDDLSGLPADEAIAYITRWRGLGRWSAECILLFGLGHPDVLPACDIGLRNAIRFFYQLPEQPGAEQVRNLAARWEPWRGYVTYYLWMAYGQALRQQVHM